MSLVHDVLAKHERNGRTEISVPYLLEISGLSRAQLGQELALLEKQELLIYNVIHKSTGSIIRASTIKDDWNWIFGV